MKFTPPLSDLEHDALTELVNIGISQAATNFRKMIDEEVLLSVPSIEVKTQKEIITLLGQREVGELVAVRQDFSGVFSGRALLIFPHANSLNLARAVIGQAVDADDAPVLAHEALAETCNIIVNSCLASIANSLQEPLHISVPEILHGTAMEIVGFDETFDDAGLVLFLHIHFSLKNWQVQGYLALLMGLPSMAPLKASLADFIIRAMGEED